MKRNPQQGESHHNTNLTVNQVKLIRKMRDEEKLSYAKIAKKFNISTASVCRICLNQSWKSVKYD